MSQRQDVSSLSVAALLELASRGRLRPLPLPRPARWSEGETLKLLDSILRGFPCGALVLGRGPARKGTVRLGRWSTEAPACSEVHWILDGRQRIGALIEALLPPAPRSVMLDLDRWVLEEGAIAENSQGELPGLSFQRRIALPTLVEPVRLAGWLRLHPLSQQDVAKILVTAEQLRAYRFPVCLVTMEDPEEVVTICERVNEERLDEVDRFCLRQGVGEAEAALSKIRASLQGLGFGHVDDDTIVRALRLLSRGKGIASQDLPELLLATEGALRRAIVFLQVNGGIPHEALLPYGMPLVVLTKFFHEFPRPQGTTREALRQWLWRGCAGFSLGSHGERHGDAIQEGDEEGSVRRLLALVPEVPSREAIRQDRFHAAHARSRIHLCALASLRPRHGEGPLINLGELLSEPDRTIPTIVEAPTSPLANSVANRVLHPRGSLVRLFSVASVEVLASHGITEEARCALVNGDVEGFLVHRSQTLGELVERFLARQTAPP
ncbi:MAG: DUF262 domain-containing protein [Myxococcales bacterium]|nr:DUF262 domain-containing protein [Polyangiaceae bacterium]MDW8250835.1 DUF262 domain-containing protein [Myxococcales bacterium]